VIRNIDPSGERFLVDLTRIQNAAERAQLEISSGRSVVNASDAPDQISEILQLSADIERNVQIRANLGRVKSEVDTAEAGLQEAVQLVDRASVLASQGAGTMVTPETRQILATEVQGLLEQLVAISTTSVEGRFIFSGDQDQSLLYELNLSNPNGVNRLATAIASRQIEHPNGTAFVAARTAQEIFDARNPDDSLASGNVFAAVNGLRVALENNDQAAIDASLIALGQAGDHLNIQLSFYGAVQRKISDAIDASNKLELRLKVELSGKRDADLTASILELQRSGTHEEAALRARASLPNTSLFDFLG
jgi:flagellar hook-associated protein 3 FlgL